MVTPALHGFTPLVTTKEVVVLKGLPKYAKALIAAAGAALVVLNDSGLFIDKPWFSSLVALATVVGVYKIRNRA